MNYPVKFLIILLALVGVLFLTACSTSAQVGQDALQNEALATLDSTNSMMIAFYNGNPDANGVLISESSFNKDKSTENRESLKTTTEAAMAAGADYAVMTYGDKRIVKEISDVGIRGLKRGSFRGLNRGKGAFKGHNPELRAFFESLPENATVTVELFTEDPSTAASAVASFTKTKGLHSRESRQARKAEVKASLEALNLSYQDISHKRLTSGSQSLVIE